MGVSKELISKFLIGNRFHVRLRILSPYSNRIFLRILSPYSNRIFLRILSLYSNKKNVSI